MGRSSGEMAILAALHERLLRQDPSAREILFAFLAPRMRRSIMATQRVSDPAHVESAIDDAFLLYFGSPERFMENRGSLVSWLCCVAINKLKDYRRSTRRRLSHEVPYGIAPPDPRVAFAQATSTSSAGKDSSVARLLALAHNERERAFLRMVLAGGSLGDQARTLGMPDPTVSAQRRVVALAIDRLRKRALRLRVPDHDPRRDGGRAQCA